MWYIIGVIWLALIAGVVWSYRRKRERQLAAQASKFEALLSEIKSAGMAAPVVAPTAAAPVAELARKRRLLPQNDALMYLVFRSGLPDHEIFANLSLADVLDIAPSIRGYEREQKSRKLGQHRLDLVICTRQLEVAAVVLVERVGSLNVETAHFVDTCLATAGVRLLRIDPAAPPRHTQVRDLVYGAKG